MSDERDGFMEKAADKARELFSGSGEERRVGGDPTVGRTVEPGAASHYGAQGGAGGTYRDDHYDRTRAQHLQAFDQDYDDYRREHQASSTDHARGDFGAWRTSRQSRTETVVRQTADAAPGTVPSPTTITSGGGVDASLALGESPGQGSDGPHILDRSFSGTYEDDDKQ